jgi:predicted nicotinamide N-methyase
MATAHDASAAGADLEALEASLRASFDIRIEEVSIAGHAFSLAVVRDSYALVDALAPEAFAANERLPYWADLWTSSLELARWCLTDPSVPGASVLEIGCGDGLPGIAAAHAGALVRLTDADPDALRFARYNALRNLPVPEARSRVSLEVLDWDNPGPVAPAGIILGGDVIYERSVFDTLLTLMDAALAPDGVAVLADPDRAIGHAFLERARARGYDVRSESRTVVRGDASTTVVRSHLRRHR